MYSNESLLSSRARENLEAIIVASITACYEESILRYGGWTHLHAASLGGSLR